MAESNNLSSTEKRLGYYCSDDAAPVGGQPVRSLEGCSIIPAVNNIEALNIALSSPPRAIFVLIGNPLTLPKITQRIHDAGKLCLANIDFLDGLSRDKFAAEFLAEHDVDGLVSTRADVLKAASALHMLSIQRTFAIDTAAVAATRKSLGQFKPDAVEVLPAVAAPRTARRLRSEINGIKIIGGGLIESVKEIESLLDAGIDAVTTSDPRLWII
jgi:glycerol uptake operon antiterminator